MNDGKLVDKIQELPETRILQLEGENEKLRREIIGLKKCWDDYEAACQEITALRKFLSQIYDASHNLCSITYNSTRRYFDILIWAAKKIPKKHKHRRNKIIRILRTAKQKQLKLNRQQAMWLYKWADDPLYKFD